MVVTQKMGIGVAVFALGNVLSLSGYQASAGLIQPGTALTTIRLCMGLIPALLIAGGLLVMRRWPEKGLHLHRPASP
jgi:GPH family glycoside/pentoside/hexuronide:cation symporter